MINALKTQLRREDESNQYLFRGILSFDNYLSCKPLGHERKNC